MIPAQAYAPRQERVTDRCGWCLASTTTVVVTANGWVFDARPSCARSLVDPLFTPELPDPTGLPARHRLLR